MGIFGRLRERLGHSKKAPEAEKNQQFPPTETEPMPPPPPPRTAASSVEKTGGDFQKEDFGPKAGSEPEEGIRLPVKRHILKEIEDPFDKKDKARIFADNLDLIGLFKKGEFTEKEALKRQQSAIMARLKKKRIGPDQAKGVLDDYRYYFRKELEEAKNNRKARQQTVAEQTG